MNIGLEEMINGILEKIGGGYSAAKAEWKRDKGNRFKDGRFLAYYEAANDLGGCGDVQSIRALLKRRFEAAKREWLADRRDTFKDGRFLACFEMMNMVPAV